uniref:DNA-directed DNA polymerase n=1 Tax=Panagrolaimus superbus TaxID=310955 RepID=A0A914XU69_9BILA
MRFPILPVKHKSQMILPICRTCMEKYDLTTNQTKESCNHSMDERSFVWEGTHIELKYAMMKNYLVLDVYHVLEYEKTSKNLFRNYLKVFIAMKVHASVPPENFEDPRVRQSFVDEYKNLYDIDINPNECKFNAAKRYIAKIFNNCLWGRLCLNATGTEKQCITTEEYVDYARDETINALTAIEIEKDVLLINYKKDSNFITTTHTNLVAACYVTAAGRLHLQKFIFKIIAAGGKILYMDT